MNLFDLVKSILAVVCAFMAPTIMFYLYLCLVPDDPSLAALSVVITVVAMFFVFIISLCEGVLDETLDAFTKFMFQMSVIVVGIALLTSGFGLLGEFIIGIPRMVLATVSYFGALVGTAFWLYHTCEGSCH